MLFIKSKKKIVMELFGSITVLLCAVKNKINKKVVVLPVGGIFSAPGEGRVLWSSQWRTVLLSPMRGYQFTCCLRTALSLSMDDRKEGVCS